MIQTSISLGDYPASHIDWSPAVTCTTGYDVVQKMESVGSQSGRPETQHIDSVIEVVRDPPPMKISKDHQRPIKNW